MSPARLPQRGPVPAAIARRMSPVLRSRIENAIEALLAALDAADLDPDLEDGSDDEPSLGSIGGCLGAAIADQRCWAGGGLLDLEEENEHGGNILDERHDEEEEEPSLGAPEIHHDQRRWGQGHQGSRELDHDERNDLIRDWKQEQAVALGRHEAEMMLRQHKPSQPTAPGVVPFPLRRVS